MRSTPPFRSGPGLPVVVAGLLLLFLSTPLFGQKKSVDCSAPRTLTRADEVSTLVADGETTCEEAERILDEAKALFDRSEDLRKRADRFRKDSERERKEIDKIRDEIQDYRRVIDELRAESHELAIEAEQLRNHPGTSDSRPVAALAADGDSPPLAEPVAAEPAEPLTGRARARQEADYSYRQARLRYIDVRIAGIEDEIEAFEGMVQLNEDLATSREVTVVDLQQLALNNERTALDAEAAARAAEDSATETEEQALVYLLQAASDYIRLHLDDPKSKRNVNRVIDFIEDHFAALPLEMAAEMQDVVAEGRTAFDLN